MNKQEFISRLEAEIASLSEDEKQEILSFYNEFLDEELERSGNLNNLEDPAIIAEKLTATQGETRTAVPVFEVGSVALNKKLSIDLTFGNITIKQGETFNINHNIKGMIVREHDDVIEIIDVYKKKKGHNYIMINDNDYVLEITTPNNLEKIDIRNQFGKVAVERLRVNDLDIRVVAGDLRLDAMTINNADIKVNAGELKINNSKFEDYDFEVNAGGIKASSSKLVKGSLEVNAGEINLDLIDSEDLKINANVSMGSVKLNGSTSSCRFTSDSGTPDMEVEVSLGSIRINY